MCRGRSTDAEDTEDVLVKYNAAKRKFKDPLAGAKGRRGKYFGKMLTKIPDTR